MLKFTAALTFVVLFWIVVLPEIHEYERDNGYPFGRLCEVYRTCDR